MLCSLFLFLYTRMCRSAQHVLHPPVASILRRGRAAAGNAFRVDRSNCWWRTSGDVCDRDERGTTSMVAEPVLSFNKAIMS